MGRRIGSGLGLLAAVPLAVWAVHLGRVAAVSLPAGPAEARDGAAIVRGASHVHTTASDGRESLEGMAGFARAAGLDFLIVADHNVRPPAPHRLDGLLIVPGVELSTSRGHVLSLGAHDTAERARREADPLGAARDAGGMVVLAHPVNLRRPWEGAWEGAEGAEVVSGDSLFREAMAEPLAGVVTSLLAWPADPVLAALHLHQPPTEALARWTAALERGQPLVGLCGHDAHGYFGDRRFFEAMQLHVPLADGLPDDPAEASRRLVAAVRDGRAFCALGGLLDAGGFSFDVTDGRVRARLDYTRWPEAAEARVELWRGGTRVDAGPRAAEATAAPGLYHARVWLTVPWVGERRTFLWIFGGPLRVGLDAGGGGA